MRDAPPPAPRPPDGGPEALSPALAERLRGLPVPDPGAAYWAALPGRVTARAEGRTVSPDVARRARAPHDRAPRDRHAAPRRVSASRLALASLALASLTLSALWAGRTDLFAPASRPAPLASIPGPAPGDVAPGDTLLPLLRGTAPTPPRGGAPGTTAPRPEARREAPSAPAAPTRPVPTRPVPTQRLASAGADADAGRARRAALADSADAEGVRLLRRAQLVALALQNATGTADVSVLAPLASGLAAGLAQWRSVPGVDPALVASADVLEPIVVGLGLLAPADTAGARQLRDAARRVDLSLQLDRALIAAGRPLSPVY